MEALKDLRASEHQAIDEQIGMALSVFLPLMEDGLVSVAHVGRIVAWLGMRNAGHEIKWTDFDPRLGRATFTVEGGSEQRPPVGGPSDDSSEESTPGTSSKPSNRSSASRRTSPR